VNIPSTHDKASASEPNLVQIAADFDPTDVANDASWDKYKKKGNWLRCLMEMPDEVAGREWPNYLNRNPPSAASQWKGTLEGRFYLFHHHHYAVIDTDLHLAELRNWFWHEAYYDPEINCHFSDDFANVEIQNRIEAALSALGLDTKPVEFGGKNKCYSIEHMEEDAVDDDGYDLPVDMQTYFLDDDPDHKEYGVSIPGREIRQTLTVWLTIHRLLGLSTASPSTRNKEVNTLSPHPFSHHPLTPLSSNLRPLLHGPLARRHGQLRRRLPGGPTPRPPPSLRHPRCLLAAQPQPQEPEILVR